MSIELEALAVRTEQRIAELQKRIAGIDAMVAQGQQERSALTVDLIKEMGYRDGVLAALTLEQQSIPAKKENENASGV